MNETILSNSNKFFAILIIFFAFFVQTLFPLGAILVSSFIAVGTIFGTLLFLCRYQTSQLRSVESNSLVQSLYPKVTEKYVVLAKERKVIISKTIDETLKEILDLTTRDYVLSWYKDVAADESPFITSLEDDIWDMIQNIYTSFHQIDFVRFLSNDAVLTITRHFEKIRLCSSNKEPFEVKRYLSDPDLELDHLRAISEMLLIRFLPPIYWESPASRHLFREIFACKVLKPLMDTISEPDYINESIISYMQYREQQAESSRNAYQHAANYEEFIKMITRCESVQELIAIRLSTMSEIMYATTLNNLKRERRLDTEKATHGQRASKMDMLKGRDLKKYINQLTVAKATCEKRIALLGGPDYKDYAPDVNEAGESVQLPGKKVLSFAVIMGSHLGRKQFGKFLQLDDKAALLGFFISVEKLRQVSRDQLHQLANEAYHNYLLKSTSCVREVLSKTTLKNMEEFLIGNSGPDGFYTAQEQIYKVLEIKYYPSFLLSDIYHKYLNMETSIDVVTENSAPDEENDALTSSTRSESFTIIEQSSNIQRRLEEIQNKLRNKQAALRALELSHGREEKIVQMLSDEIMAMDHEMRKLEFCQEKTEIWCENVGAWDVEVQSAEVKENEKDLVYFTILVYVKSIETQDGWVVIRSMDDCKRLHLKLIEICPSLSKKQFSTISKPWFKSLNKDELKRMKSALEEYLKLVMNDIDLVNCEALYNFMCPSPEYLKSMPHSPAVKRFLGRRKREKKRDADIDLLFAEEDSLDLEKKDSTAQPLYALMDEVFELQGTFKIFRKTLLMFVKVTYGGTINRQIRDFLRWTYSDVMIVYYLHSFREFMWPERRRMSHGKPNSRSEQTTTAKKDKEKLVETARKSLLANLPDALVNLVGQQNARQGVLKMFEVLQQPQLNKHLLYDLLELFMREIFPEKMATAQQSTDC